MATIQMSNHTGYNVTINLGGIFFANAQLLGLIPEVEYRSAVPFSSSDYGANFTLISDQLDGSDTSPALWPNFFVSPTLVTVYMVYCIMQCAIILYSELPLTS